MRTTSLLRTSVALAAATALLGACSDSDADDDTTATPSSSESSEPSEPAGSSPSTPADLPAGVLALPEAPTGGTSIDVAAGRYRVRLDDALSFDVTLPAGSTVHDNGLFLATPSFVLKTELAGEEYGVPRDPCTDQTIEPAGSTVEDLVAALSDLPAYEVSAPEAVELGGAEGAYLEARVPRGYDDSKCAGGAVQLPGNPDTAVGGPAPYTGRWWVLDVEGRRVVVQQNCWGCSDRDLARAPKTAGTITFTATP